MFLALYLSNWLFNFIINALSFTNMVLHKVVNESYNQIASKFSKSRNKPWLEFDLYNKIAAPNSNILDIGCGNGRLLLSLNKPGIAYTALDISSEMLVQAKQNLASVNCQKTFVCSNFLDANLGANSFDSIFSVACLHHIHGFWNRLAFLNAIYDCLKPNATACVSVWNLWQPRYAKNFKQAAKKSLFARRDLNIKFGQTARYYHAFGFWELKFLVFCSKFRACDILFVDKQQYLPSQKNSHNMILILNK